MAAVVVSPVAGMSFLSAIYAGSWPVAYLSLNGTSTYEMLRLLDQIERDDLSRFLACASSLEFCVNVPRILAAAEVVLTRKVPASGPDDILPEAKKFLEKRSPLQIPRDPSGTLPAPIPGLAGPTEADYQAGADLLGVEKATIHAVATVESGGRTGFSADGRCIIRYELHVFQKRTKSKFSLTHPHLSQSYEAGKGYHKGGQPNEWSMMYGAILLRRREDAISSASWGMFQIMGFNYADCGYTSASTFAADMCVGSGRHLQAFLKLCKARGWHKYLAKKDWAGFAYHYNGSKYADNHYDTHLAEAYARYAKAS